MRSSSCSFFAALAALVGAACGGNAGAHVDDGLSESSAALAPAWGAGVNDAPRLTRVDTPTEAQRSLPGYRNELTETSYRWWASSGRADLGFGLGTLAYQALPSGSVAGLAGDGASRAIATGTVLTMGLRYRTSDASAVFADASGVRGLGLDNGDAVIGKVGFEFKSAQSRWNVSYGGLGLRLAGDARMTLRLRRGGLGIYMRSSF